MTCAFPEGLSGACESNLLVPGSGVRLVEGHFTTIVGGPRESRRLMGDVVLTQDDIVAKRDFPDGCVPSTWSIDLHYPKEEFADKFADNPFISIAVHDRPSREKKRARAAILEDAAGLGRVRVIGGKQVVNILPEGAPHKGLALVRERERLGCDTAIYVGDDETDEDVFALEQPGRLVGIRVGARRSSRASYFLRNQAAVDELLSVLSAFRAEPLARASRS